MSGLVGWVESALDRLADLFVTAWTAERDEIEATVLRINAALAADPWALGESRSGNRRVWFTYPLMVVYRIAPTEGRVVVSRVARLRRRA